MSNIHRILCYDWPLHFVLFITNWMPDNVIILRLRGWLASPFFKKCGRNLRLGRDITFYNSSNIVIGNDVYIAKGCWFSAGFMICIEDEVLFGPYVVVASSNHTKKGLSFRHGNPVGGAVIFEYGSWISAHCVITAGSKVGKGSVIGANSTVKGDVIENSLYAGSPAKRIKHI